jgi:hypothetical protein
MESKTTTRKPRQRSLMVNIRMSEAEKRLLEAHASANLCDVSTYIRQRCLGISPRGID